METPDFTILLPIVRPPDLMRFAIGSILRQTRPDFELMIILDGAPEETAAVARQIAATDDRIRVFAFPKGERHGEAHRHAALQLARGRYVCGVADDDLWFPEHLEELGKLLSEVDFGHLLHANILTSGGLPFLGFADLADPAVRAKMLAELFNFFGPSSAGYRLETYGRMPEGWSPAPVGVPSDLTMWRKFLSLPDITVGTRFVLTVLHFAASQREGWTLERRRDEIAVYAARLESPVERDRIRQQAFAGAAREYFVSHEYIKTLIRRAEAVEHE